MSGALVLAGLLALAALPMALAYPLIAHRRPSFVPQRFFLAAGLGILAVIPAALVQILLPRPRSGFFALFFGAFGSIATVEELSKFAILRLLRRLLAGSEDDGPAAGVAASLGFALFETAAYSSSDLGIAVIRAFTAAPLHAACGARVGLASYSPRFLSGRSLFALAAAIALHGVYDLALVLPGYPVALPISLALIALASAIPLIQAENNGDF
jgi:RsiW-degrading membrane proteinase PrsW (M82 family)